jgi:hypothetical protein
MKWDIYKAKQWMINAGMDHIRDGLSSEGGDLIYESKWGDACDSEQKFFSALKRILWWDTDEISEEIRKIKGHSSTHAAR